METNISLIKQQLDIHYERIEGTAFQHSILEESLEKVEIERDPAQQENMQLLEKLEAWKYRLGL